VFVVCESWNPIGNFRPSAGVVFYRRFAMNNDNDKENRTKERAHHLWEVEGKPEGKHKEHWEQAEKELSKAGPGEERTPDKKIGEVKFAEENAQKKK
jgi:hypothetical protein